MAKIYLDSGETFTLSGAASVLGSTGTEKLIINSGVTGVVADQNVERVDLAGASSTYTFQQSGNQLKVFSGTTLVATIPLQDDADGTQVVFSNGSVSAKVGATGMTLGGATVPSAAAAAVTPTTIDATVTSGSGTSTGTTTGQAFSLTSSTTADTLVLTSGNDTVTGAAGALNGTGTNDLVLDASTTDNDTANVVVTVAATPTFSNVENINFNFGLGAGAVTATNISGAKSIGIGSAEAGATVGSIAAAKTGNTFDVSSAMTSFTLTTNGTAAASGETATVKLNGSTALTLATATTGAAVANDVDVLTLNSTTAANTITIQDTAAGFTNSFAASGESIIVTGDKNLTIKTAGTTGAGLNGATITNNLTGGATLTIQTTGISGTQDFTKIAANLFTLSTAASAGTQTFANNSTVKMTFDQGANTLAVGGTTTGTIAVSSTVNQGTSTTINNASTVNLSVTDSVTYADLKLGNSTTLNAANLMIAGTDATKTLTLTTANAKVIDASGFAGKLVLNGEGVNVTTVIGGANDDTVVYANQAITVNGGAGNDTLNAGAVTGSKAISVSGGDGNDTITLGVASTGSTYDGGAGNDVFVQTTAGVAGELVGNLVGGAGTDTLTLAAGANDVSGNTFTLSSIDVINVAALNNTATFKGSQLTGQTLSIVADGATDVVVVNRDVAGTGQSIDLSGINHNLTNAAGLAINGSTQADIIKGSKALDTITTNGGADIITGGGGADIITGITAYGAGKVITTLTDAHAGNILTFTDKGTETFAATAVSVTAATSLATAFGIAASNTDGSTNGAFKWFQYSGDTYLIQVATNNATVVDLAATDFVIKLSGLVDLSGTTGGATNILTLA